jgi:hypothetical protein
MYVREYIHIRIYYEIVKAVAESAPVPTSAKRGTGAASARFDRTSISTGGMVLKTRRPLPC